MIEGEVLILRRDAKWPLALRRSPRDRRMLWPEAGMRLCLEQAENGTLLGMALAGKLRCVY